MAFGVLAMVLQGIVFAYFYPLFYRHKGGGTRYCADFSSVFLWA